MSKIFLVLEVVLTVAMSIHTIWSLYEAKKPSFRFHNNEVSAEDLIIEKTNSSVFDVMHSSKDNLFELLWDCIIVSEIELTSQKYKLEAKNLKIVKRVTKHVFDKETQIFLKSYMVDGTQNIDRHKIAACAIKAILASKPIYISFAEKVKFFFGKGKIEDECFLANEYLAFGVAIKIIETYILSDKDKKLKHDIHCPVPFPKEDKDYVRDFCMGLYHIGYRRFNTVGYANTLFLLEKYSCRFKQCDNLENELLNKLLFEGEEEQKVKESLHNIKFRA